MTSSLYRITSTKSSVSHTTNSEDALSVSSEGSDDDRANYLGYSSPPIQDNSKRGPSPFFQLVSSDSPDYEFYKSKLMLFQESKKITYAFTVSPQSTPLMRNKKPLQQVDILKRIVNEVCDQYEASYICCYEFYSNMSDIHLHGFLIVTVKHIDDIKRDLRKILYRNKPPLNEKLAAIPVQIKRQGIDMRAGWVDYCSKDLKFMIKNNMYPFYKIRF